MTKRINYIDGLRGFTMFLVVFGHVLSKSFLIEPNSTFISTFLLTFRMPMFFFISGFIAYKGTEYWSLDFFQHRMLAKARIQIIPTTIFFSLFCYSFMGSFINPIEYGWLSYWFTIVLFEMYICYFCLSLIGKYTSDKVVDIGMIILSIAGIVWLAKANRSLNIYNITCFENLAKYIQFFTLGVLCRKYNNSFVKIVSSDKYRTIFIVIFITCLILIYNEKFKGSSYLLYSFVHDILVRYFGLMVVFVFFFSRRSFFDNNSKIAKIFLYIGRRTLDIYLIHFFFLPHMEYLKEWMLPNEILVQVTLATAVSIITIFLCLLVSEILRTSDILAFYLFGFKKK